MSFKSQNIPAPLKVAPQWVCYRRDKTPVDPKSGQAAKANDPNTWGTFEQAVRYFEKHKQNGIAGIGREFSFYDPYCGIDLDHCRDPKTGEIEAWAREIVERFNSYTEVSPSGTGLHVWIKAKLPPGADHQKNLPGGGKIEVYDCLRFFTVSGHHVKGTPATVQDRDKELKSFYAQVIAKPKAPPKSAGPGPTLSLADSEIIEKARSAQNGNKFDRLMQGDTSEYGGDDSSADLALCCLLAFWTQDRDQIDRVFRASNLYRDKWERADYRERTINKALAGVTETFKPRSKPQDRPGAARAQEKPRPRPQTSTTPIWPQEVMTGAAGKFARTYANYLETPENFLFMNYLTILGHIVSDRVILPSEVSLQPRLFLVNLGESADARKSTSISQTFSFFRETISPDDINGVFGVGSAEGLAKCFKKNKRAILILDELKSLIQKMRIDASVLLPCINTLFESKHFHSITKKHEINIDDAELCLLAASTLDTYRNMFNSTFLDIGFLNRLFIVIGESKRKFSIPGKVPQGEKDSLKTDLRDVLSFLWELSGSGPFTVNFNSTAREIFDDWYFNLESSSLTKRLDSYGHRLMPLLAVNEMQTIITPEIAKKTVALLNYQLAARNYADPIDADTPIARLEERIRRTLEKFGPMSKRDLERSINKARVGIWTWDTAIKNLRNAGDIFWDSKTKEYRFNV